MGKLFFLTLLCFFWSGVVNADQLDTNSLKERVQARWNTLGNHAFGSAYSYETPNFKKVFAKNLFVKMYSSDVNWHFVDIESVEYDPLLKVATVITKVDTTSVNLGDKSVGDTKIPVKFNEKWLHINGQWWHSSTN